MIFIVIDNNKNDFSSADDGSIKVVRHLTSCTVPIGKISSDKDVYELQLCCVSASFTS